MLKGPLWGLTETGYLDTFWGFGRDLEGKIGPEGLEKPWKRH